MSAVDNLMVADKRSATPSFNPVRATYSESRRMWEKEQVVARAPDLRTSSEHHLTTEIHGYHRVVVIVKNELLWGNVVSIPV